MTLSVVLSPAGCLGIGGSGDVPSTDGPDQTTVQHTADPLNHRLGLAATDGATVWTTVTIRNRSGDDEVVFHENLPLETERDLSEHFDDTSTYVVELETGGDTTRYPIGNYEGLTIHMNETGVVWVEAELT